MNIIEEQHGDVVVLQLDGGLGYDNHRDFAEAVERLLGRGIARVVLDLDRLIYLSSWGIGSVLSATAKCRHQDGGLILVNVRHDLLHILNIMRLVKVLDIEDSVEDALRAFSAQTPDRDRSS